MLNKQIFEKIAKNQALTPTELVEFVQFGDHLQSIEAMFTGIVSLGTTTLFLKFPRISNPVWETNPLHTLFVERQTDVAITTGVDTVVTWENKFGDTTIFRLNSDNQKVDLAWSMPFTVHGVVGFAGNSTGFRNAKLVAYDKDNNVLGTAPMFNLPGQAGGDNTYPFSYPVTVAISYPVAYFKMTVSQTSGADLNLIYMDLGVSVG